MYQIDVEAFFHGTVGFVYHVVDLYTGFAFGINKFNTADPIASKIEKMIENQ